VSDPIGNAVFQGQVAIVTGAASGIGAATARILGQRGAHVIAADLDQARLSTVADDIRASGGTVSPVPTDISDPDSVAALVSVAKQAGELRILVNSAGITGILGSRLHELPIEEFDRVIGINLRGAILLTQAVLPTMLAAKYGRIMHVASIAGKEGNPRMTPYDASKSGLIGFVKGAAKEYAGDGVLINAMAPAVIRSPMIEGEPQDVVDYMVSRIPMGRMGEPEEVAEVIAFAVSAACSFTTGFVFDTSGGRATY
jgi:NAD(P)-dependent dehydrogenase (short-subunit alcohol dehydrogenase family)